MNNHGKIIVGNIINSCTDEQLDTLIVNEQECKVSLGTGYEPELVYDKITDIISITDLPFTLNIMVNPRIVDSDITWLLSNIEKIFTSLSNVRQLYDGYYSMLDDLYGELNIWRRKDGREFLLNICLGDGKLEVPISSYLESKKKTIINVEQYLLGNQEEINNFFIKLLGEPKPPM